MSIVCKKLCFYYSRALELLLCFYRLSVSRLQVRASRWAQGPQGRKQV